jgi:hypothetical protein
LVPQVVPVATTLEVAETKVVFVGVKPPHTDNVSPAFSVTASCPPSGPSSEIEKSGLVGAPNVNVAGAFPVFVSVRERGEAGLPTAVGPNSKEASGVMVRVAPEGVAESG